MNNTPQHTQIQVKEKIPYQHETFVDFIAVLGRLFYDDPSIVLLDLFGTEQHAFTETDLKEKLGWRDSLIQQKLYLLEKHMITVQDTTYSRGGSKSNTYWRLNHNIYAAVQFRYRQLISKLSCLVDSTVPCYEFECSKPECGEKYTALDAACCTRSLDSEHPLCEKCNTPLKSSEVEATRAQARKKCISAIKQLEPLHQKLLNITYMDIPVFKPYSKSDKLSAISGRSHLSSSEHFNEDKPSESFNETTAESDTSTTNSLNFKLKSSLQAPKDISQQTQQSNTHSTSIPWFENTVNKPLTNIRSTYNNKNLNNNYHNRTSFSLRKQK